MASYRQTDRAKCWFRRRLRTTTSSIVGFCLLGAGPAHPQSDSAAEPWPPVLTRFLEEVRTFSAEFEQEIWSEDLEPLETAAGTVRIRRPNRFLWTYTSPYSQVIVADGSTLWMYDADIEQATRSRLDEATPASPAMLLSGDTAILDSFDVVDESVEGGVHWITLVPRTDSGEFDRVRLGFEDDDLTRLEFVNGLEQTTVIRFSSIDTATPLPDDVFEFKPPRGTHILGDAD